MRTADKFCDLAGFDPEREEAVVYAHDGSQLTLIEIDGTRSIVSSDDYLTNVIERFAGGISQILKRPGHQLTISYESSLNTARLLDPFVDQQTRRARQKGLAVEALIEEGRTVLEGRARAETILLAAWTRPTAGTADEVKREQKENRKAWQELPPAREAQNPYLRLGSLDGVHGAFVRRIMEAIGEARLQGRILAPDDQGRRRDLEQIRAAVLYHETPDGWTPYGPGTRRYPGAKERHDDDVSEFFTPSVARQIMTSNAQAANNMRALDMGGRRYALAVMRMFPSSILPFNRLLDTLLESSTRAADMPFRVCFHLEALRDADVGFRLKKVLAGLLAFASPTNKNLFKALRELEDVVDKDGEAIVKGRVIATTWTEPGEDIALLERRRSYLMSGMMTWGEAVMTDAPHHPLRALCETVAGMTVQAQVPPGSIVPLGDLAALLPFHRTAGIFKQGQSMLVTPDGKPVPYEALSAEQLFWLTLIYATPGSGKSVLMNRLNVEFAAFSAGAALPFLAVIDVGVSSSGFIELVRNALPAERRHEAYYVRLLNTPDYAVNPFDLGLGRRMPLVRERTFVDNFLTTLLNVASPEAALLIPRLITRVYQLKSDLQFSSSPAIYQPNVDPELDRLIAHHGIPVVGKTRWWRIVDAFVERKLYVAAQRAQRHAMPVLEDLARVLGEPIMAADFTPELVRSVQRALESAIEKFPIFARPTRLDLGEARVVSIDLQDVAQRHKSPEAERNNALMFMIARHVYLSKISGFAEEIAKMDFPTEDALRAQYVRYWEARYHEVAETPKRLCMDEYHLTGGVETIARQVKSDAREGRKWGLELILVSQLLADFDTLADMASTVLVLNADSNEIREEARRVFGFDAAVKSALERQVHGPQGRRGANLLARFKLREEERWIVLNNSLGPRMLWALTTKAEDRLVRDELYRRMAVNDALRILATRFPDGTAIDAWSRVAALARFGEDRIAKTIVDQVLGEIMSEARPLIDGKKTAA
jgi:intracellular multiplication protein IcmB